MNDIKLNYSIVMYIEATYFLFIAKYVCYMCIFCLLQIYNYLSNINFKSVRHWLREILRRIMGNVVFTRNSDVEFDHLKKV